MTKLFDILTFLDYIDPATTSELATYIYCHPGREAKNAVRQLIIKLQAKGWDIDVVPINNADNLYTLSQPHNELVGEALADRNIMGWLDVVHKCPCPESLAGLLSEGV